MEIHKNFIDLIGHTKDFDGLSVIPSKIDADDTNCVVEFQTMNKLRIHRVLVRKGKHKDFIFTTSIHKIPFTIDLRTGQIKKIRERKD